MERNTPQNLVQEVLNSPKTFVHGWFLNCMDSNTVHISNCNFPVWIDYNRSTKKCSLRTRKHGEIVFNTLNDVYRFGRGLSIIRSSTDEKN